MIFFGKISLIKSFFYPYLCLRGHTIILKLNFCPKCCQKCSIKFKLIISNVWCQIVLVPNCPGAKLSILLYYFGAKLSVFNFGAKLSNNPYMMTKRQKRGYAKRSDLAPSISDARKFQTRTKLKPTMFNSTSDKAISDLIYDSSIP